eukprot:COSAG06_NODE_2877_length_6143_cov_1410.664851_6_plen_362_part_00
MEQGNQLLDQATDANDAIRDANLQTTQTYNGQVSKNKEMAEGEEWYHGVTDAFGAHGAFQSVASTRARMADKGLSYSGLAAEDFRNLASGNIGKNVGKGAAKGGAKAGEVANSLQKGLKDAGQVETVAGGGVQSSADLGFKAGATVPGAGNVESSADLTTPTPAEPSPAGPAGAAGGAGEGAGKTATTAITDAGKGAAPVEEKAAGTLFERGIQAATGGRAAVGSIANAGLGKVLGNVGGGIDIVKDFANIGSKGGFFGGTGATTGDEVSNALTVGGSVLDVASIALPFLAPIAGAVQIAGAIDGTYESVKDSQAQASATNASYQGDLKSDVVPPSLAGVGFLATAQSDPRKLIGGGGGTF